MHAFLLNDLVDIIDHLRRRVFVSANEERHIGNAVQQIGIADEGNRSGIDDDVIVAFTQFCEELLYPIGLDQLRRIRWNRSARNDIQVLMLATRYDDIVDGDIGFSQIIGQVPLGRQVEIGSQHRFADVETYQCHFLTQDSEREGDVTRHIRLTVAVDRRGDQNHR